MRIIIMLVSIALSIVIAACVKALVKMAITKYKNYQWIRRRRFDPDNTEEDYQGVHKTDDAEKDDM